VLTMGINIKLADFTGGKAVALQSPRRCLCGLLLSESTYNVFSSLTS
jgi:hypothetical protein